MKNSIAFCGNIITDQIKMIPRWPDRGMLVPISSVKRAVGGSVSNTAIDLKTLDPAVAVAAIGEVGADDNGDFAVGVMEARGIDLRSGSGRVAALTRHRRVIHSRSRSIPRAAG